MPARVVVLGGGVGGTLVANLLDKELNRDARVTVVDPTGMHDYQPGYLYVALGEAKGHWLSREERTLLRPGVDLAIEKAVRKAIEDGKLKGSESLPVAMTLSVGALALEVKFDGDLKLD